VSFPILLVAEIGAAAGERAEDFFPSQDLDRTLEPVFFAEPEFSSHTDARKLAYDFRAVTNFRCGGTCFLGRTLPQGSMSLAGVTS